MPLLAAAVVTVIVELFTSEGCSSCPPADVLLQKLVDSQPVADVQIVALGEHVDYWDRLGWKDRFSSAALTGRQQSYGNHFRLDSIYTPQMVVDGRAEFVGTDAKSARKALEQARQLPHGALSVRTDGGPDPRLLNVSVTADHLPPLSSGDRADIIVALTEDKLHTDVKRGENEGKELAHVAVVRQLATIGEAAAIGPTTATTQLRLDPDWNRDNLHVVVFVQARRARAIVASATTQATR